MSENTNDTSSEEGSVLERRSSIIDMIMEKQNDQDFKQKTNVFTLMLEIYRVLMGAFLIAFVPQKCDETICTLGQNIGRTDNFSIIVVTMNGATFLVFLLYFIEVKRENKLITYLEVNRLQLITNQLEKHLKT